VLEGFVGALARRSASFDRRAIAAAKNLINPSGAIYGHLTNWLNSTIWWISTTLKSRGIKLRGHRGTILPHLTVQRVEKVK
jgi:hypothetical protein